MEMKLVDVTNAPYLHLRVCTVMHGSNILPQIIN